MATTYTWDIHNVDVIPFYNGNANVVSRVVWQCTATSDDGKSKNTMGVIELDINTTSTNFISIDEVTKEQIVAWVKEKVAVKSIEDGLQPDVKTINFANITGTNITVAAQLAAAEVQEAQPPNPAAVI